MGSHTYPNYYGGSVIFNVNHTIVLTNSSYIWEIMFFFFFSPKDNLMLYLCQVCVTIGIFRGKPDHTVIFMVNTYLIILTNACCFLFIPTEALLITLYNLYIESYIYYYIWASLDIKSSLWMLLRIESNAVLVGEKGLFGLLSVM